MRPHLIHDNRGGDSNTVTDVSVVQGKFGQVTVQRFGCIVGRPSGKSTTISGPLIAYAKEFCDNHTVIRGSLLLNSCSPPKSAPIENGEEWNMGEAPDQLRNWGKWERMEGIGKLWRIESEMEIQGMFGTNWSRFPERGNDKNDVFINGKGNGHNHIHI